MSVKKIIFRNFSNSKASNGKAGEEASDKSDNYWNKQLDGFISTLKSSSQMGSANDPLCILRKEIIDTLQELLLGDALAAEYLLMHLLSTV